MKQKKKWIIPICVVGVLLLVCAGILWYAVDHSMGFTVGRCLVADNGSYLLIDGNSPIVMSNRKDKDGLFDGLKTGDKILVLHDGVAESYPGRTGAYWCWKQEEGTLDDIPETVLSELTEMGWLFAAEPIEPIAATGFVGISRTSATSAYQDPWGVKLTAKNITPSGLTIVCTQQDGEPTGELQTGSYYGLEVLRDGKWVAVDLLPMDYELAWTSEAWIIPGDEETEWEVDWTRLYGELPVGNYRIGKSIMDFRGTGDYDTNTYYAAFDIVDTEVMSSVTYEYDGFGVSLPYVNGWEYKITECDADGMSYGISFRPVGEEGWIDFHYWPSFGVCGTGLETKEFGNGSMGTYDGNPIWSFISYPASKGNFVANTQGVSSWWSKYGEAAMEIIEQAICVDTIVD